MGRGVRPLFFEREFKNWMGIGVRRNAGSLTFGRGLLRSAGPRQKWADATEADAAGLRQSDCRVRFGGSRGNSITSVRSEAMRIVQDAEPASCPVNSTARESSHEGALRTEPQPKKVSLQTHDKRKMENGKWKMENKKLNGLLRASDSPVTTFSIYHFSLVISH